VEVIRYPLEALEHALDTRSREIQGQPSYNQNLALVLDIPFTRIAAHRKRGLSVALADELAVRANLHPSLVWPSWFDDALQEPGCKWCGAPVPMKSLQGLWCTRQCHNRLQWEERCLAARAREWWTRLDRYRESDILSVVA
jgi:hypothetical protein